MAASKPVFVLVPGAWHAPQAFDPTTKLLIEKGYTSRYVDLVSTSDASIQHFEPDVDRAKEAIQETIAAGKDVVLVMHSYGGAVGSEALKHFVDDNEGKEGKGKILRIVYLCAFVLPGGTSLMDGLGGVDLPWWNVEGDVVNPRDPKTIFYNDLDDDEAEKYIKLLRPHAYRTFSSKVTFEPWRTIPSTYILCENDHAIPLVAQEAMVAQAVSKAPNAFDVVERCSASHSPFASSSQPDILAGFLHKAAGGAKL